MAINTTFKGSGTLETGCHNHNEQEEEGSGRLLFPTYLSHSIDQGKIVGRLSFPDVNFESIPDALDPVDGLKSQHLLCLHLQPWQPLVHLPHIFLV